MDYLQISELYHYGIKGQKWGVRRYQNEDGTLTEEGKAHYSTSSSDTKQNDKQKSKQKNSSSKESNNQNKTSSKETDSVNSRTLAGKRIEDLTDKELQAVIVRRNNEKRLRESMQPKKEEPKTPEYDKAFRDASKLAKDIADALPKGNGKVIKKDYSDLSDQELRNRISRLQLEDSYGKLTGDTKYVKSGSEKAREVLQTAGALLAVAGSAAALALTIQEIRKNKKLNLSQSDILDEDENSLEHHGIKGQKWGLRRYQNEDGTLTEAGRLRYGGKTHVSELDDDELEDLNEAIRYQHKKKLAIGIGVAVTAAAAIIGATWIAKKRQESLQQPQTKQVLNKTEVASKSPQYHMHQPDTVKPNVFALPAPKKDFIDVDFKDVTPKSSSAKPNIPDWLKKSGNGSKPLSSLKQAVYNTPKYNPRAVTDTYHKTANRYYRLEKDIHGNPFKISKSDWAKAPKIHINHHDMSDYLVFRAIYHSMMLGIGYYASDELYHHGIKGQKWGVRRYQDVNGSLTPEGRQRYRTDKGTQDILDNSSKYSALTRKQRNELSNYGRFSGGKRGFIAGLAGGATLGVGKTVLDLVTSEAVRKSSSTAIVNRFTRNIMLGALGGSVVGTLVGSVAGKKSAQAQYADRGKIYVEELLNTPIKRIRSR